MKNIWKFIGEGLSYLSLVLRIDFDSSRLKAWLVPSVSGRTVISCYVTGFVRLTEGRETEDALTSLPLGLSKLPVGCVLFTLVCNRALQVCKNIYTFIYIFYNI